MYGKSDQVKEMSSQYAKAAQRAAEQQHVVQGGLFGDEEVVVTATVKKPQTSKTKKWVVTGRKFLFGNNENRRPVKIVPIEQYKTRNTGDVDFLLSSVESLLGFRPKLTSDKKRWEITKNGDPLYDVLTGEKFIFVGPDPVGPRSAVRDMRVSQAILHVRSFMAKEFMQGEDDFIVKHTAQLLSMRLQSMRDDEDVSAMTKALLELIRQHDFIDNARTGETIRNCTKYQQTRMARGQSITPDVLKGNASETSTVSKICLSKPAKSEIPVQAAAVGDEADEFEASESDVSNLDTLLEAENEIEMDTSVTDNPSGLLYEEEPADLSDPYMVGDFSDVIFSFDDAGVAQ